MSTPLDNLVYCLGLNEASGDALDLSGNGKTFTQTGAVPAATGHIVGARGPAEANNHFSRATDSDMAVAGESFAIAVWSRPLSTGNYAALYCGLPYTLNAINTDGKPAFLLNDQAFNLVEVLGPVVDVDAWCWLFAWYDAVAQEIGIQVNNGVAGTASFTGTPFGTDGITHYVQASGADMLLEQLCFWKGRIPSQTERDGLYNAGAGVTFDAFGDINKPTTRLRMDHRYLHPRVR